MAGTNGLNQQLIIWYTDGSLTIDGAGSSKENILRAYAKAEMYFIDTTDGSPKKP